MSRKTWRQKDFAKHSAAAGQNPQLARRHYQMAARDRL
jgi:hypothetical protein